MRLETRADIGGNSRFVTGDRAGELPLATWCSFNVTGDTALCLSTWESPGTPGMSYRPSPIDTRADLRSMSVISLLPSR
jgi:hypothetical protein